MKALSSAKYMEFMSLEELYVYGRVRLYRIRGKFRWAKVSRLRLTKHIRGKTFALHL